MYSERTHQIIARLPKSILVLGLAAFVGTVPVVAQAPENVWAGIFTAEQAARGAEAYAASCAGCHGAELRATDPNAPDLRGPTYNFSWVGSTVGERFARIRDTMPASAPHSLPDGVYADIVAHILAVNGVPAGDTELPADEAYLDSIAITAAP